MLVPEGISKKYDSFVRKYRLVLILSLFFILIFYIAFIFYKVNKDLLDGSNLKNLRESISLRLLDSCAVGLDNYKAIYGNYPSTEGKYFFDSIKLLVYIDEVYIYTENKNLIDLMNSSSTRDSLLLKYNLYIGIGSSEQYLTYKYLNNGQYLLYTVGENGIDELGDGDDLVY